MRLSGLVGPIVLALLLIPLGGYSQTDRTDPVAVAEAYAEACRVGDIDMAIGFLHPDDPLRFTLADAARVMGGGTEQGGFSLARILTEFMFAPMEFGFEVGDATVEPLDDRTTRVTLTRTWAVDQMLVMDKAGDGTWSIDALESVKATTGSGASFLQTRMGAMAGGRSGPPSTQVMDSENRLRRLARALQEYADEHDNALPPAASWADAVEPYVMDRDVFACPGAPEQEYGYAMNAVADRAKLPQDWEERGNTILLFEWRGAERNATAMPEELADMEPFWPDGTIVIVDASQNTRRIAQGTTLAGLAAADQHRETCEKNVLILTRAALRYAGHNDGLLPGPDTWQDDIFPYLPGDTALADVLHCPAADGIDFGYAINSEVAGMDAKDIRGHERVTLFFESDRDVPDACGSPDVDGPAEFRHLDRWDGKRCNVVGILDGSVTCLSAPHPGP